MSGLPNQLPWRRFLCVLHRLGYRPKKAGRGSARVFFNPARQPATVSFREPHRGGSWLTAPTFVLPALELHHYSGGVGEIAYVGPTELAKGRHPPGVVVVVELAYTDGEMFTH